MTSRIPMLTWPTVVQIVLSAAMADPLVRHKFAFVIGGSVGEWDVLDVWCVKHFVGPLNFLFWH
jgi:hypothetical protein